MRTSQEETVSVEERDAKELARQVRRRFAAFGEILDIVRHEDTDLVLETMEDYTARNAEVDLATAGVLG